MTYTKPEINLTANSTEVIQGSTIKPPSVFLDANNVDYNATSTAYEADE
jgi:hypothetical protein